MGQLFSACIEDIDDDWEELTEDELARTVSILQLRSVIYLVNNGTTDYLKWQKPERSNTVISVNYNLFGKTTKVYRCTRTFAPSTLTIGTLIGVNNLHYECKVVLSEYNYKKFQESMERIYTGANGVGVITDL